MAARRRSPAPPANPHAPEAPHGDLAATPRSARGHSEGLVLWPGCTLVPADPKNPKMIPASAQVGLKIDLVGWPKMGKIPAYTCKSPAPIDVLKNVDHEPDNLHRMFGACKVQVQAWTLSETGALHKPIQAKVHTFDPCEFDDADTETDPDYPEDDVGTERWAIGQSAAQSDLTLKKELTRRNEVRRELAQGDDDFDDEEEDDRGRGRARPGSGNRRDWGRSDDRGRGGRGVAPRGRGGADDVPEEMFDTSWTPPPAAPGMEWGWDDRASRWRQYPKGSTVAAPVAAQAPVEQKLTFMEMMERAAIIVATVAPALVPMIANQKPAQSPMELMAAMMTAMNGNKADPVELKRMEIEADTRRADALLAAENARIERENNRIEAARLAADAQRAHDAKMEADRRDAARQEAIAADDRARQRAKEDQERLIALKQSGLIAPEGPTEAQRKAELDLEMMKLRVEMMEKAPKTQSDLELYEKLKGTLSKFGVKFGEGASETSMADVLDTPAAKAMAEHLAPAIGAVLMKFAGASPTPLAPIVAPAPNIHIPDPLAAHHAIQREVAERERLAQEFGRQEGFAQAQQLAAQNAGAPEQAPEAPPAMPQWEDAAPPPEPPAEAPADPEPTPVPAAEPEAPAAPVVEESAPVAEAPAPPAEPEVSVIDRAPDGSTDVALVTEAA